VSAILKNSHAVRPMTRTDLAKVMLVELAEYPFPWTERIFADCLRVGYHCWVAEVEEKLIGYGIMSTGAGEAHILNICIGRAFQGKGLGRALLLHLLDEARAIGVDTVFLEVRPSNATALALYDSVGFNCIGTRKDYYPAKFGREDATLLALTLCADEP
jgi:ribosomal-protein-alanine N-acetyltransferase